MDVGATGSSSANATVAKEDTGFNALTSEDFLKLLVTQLQNQDPLEPVGNDQLLNQLSQMRSLQSNIELGDAIKSITLNQQLSSGAAFIDRYVSGVGDQNEEISGIADRVSVRNGETFIGIGIQELRLDQITTVKLADS